MNDIQAAPELTRDIIGCPVVGGRGYDSDAFCRLLVSQNSEPVIPGRRNRKAPISYDEEKYKKQGLIERIFGKLKENRRLAVRYEKSDINFLGFILVAFLKTFLC